MNVNICGANTVHHFYLAKHRLQCIDAKSSCRLALTQIREDLDFAEGTFLGSSLIMFCLTLLHHI